jgi:hypothetical protein
MSAGKKKDLGREIFVGLTRHLAGKIPRISQVPDLTNKSIIW